MRRLIVLAILVTTMLVGAFLFRWHLFLPRDVAFGEDADAWTPYGGAWQPIAGMMRNNSDERGAKLLGGSPFWRDYSVEADVALLGNYGDAGLIVRAHDASVGVDSYTGFFAGLRTLDNTLILGRSDYGWEEYKAEPVPGNVKVRHPYHLHIIAVGCAIAVRVDLPNGESVREGVEIAHCNRSGQVGLKSYQTPALWSNLHVAPATRLDLSQMMQGKALDSASNGTLHSAPGGQVDYMEPIQNDALNHRLEGTTTPIAQLRLRPTGSGTTVSVRGVVRLLSPITYIEDGSGGLVVASHDAPALAIGDDVEVTGTVSTDAGQPVLKDGRVKILWSNSPAAPRLVTADQAAAGSEDGRFVVLEGRLLRTWRTPLQIVLELESQGVVFRALAEANRYDRQLQSLKPQSMLQLAGVVRSDPAFAGDSSFALLLSPTQDAVRVLHAPPWWSATHIAELSLMLLVLVVGGILIYHRLRHRYLLHIVEERELLAHDLHDTVSQSFAGIGYQLRAIQDGLQTGPPMDGELERAQKMVSETHRELRRSITTLRMNLESVEDIGAALASCARRLVQGGRLRVEYLCAGTTRRLPLRVADCLFRIGQEAIANAVLHADATALQIALHYEDRRLILTIKDNGRGIPEPPSRSAGSGLYGMAKRAEVVGALFRIDSNGCGTTVSVEAQLARQFYLFGTPLLFTRRTESKAALG